MKTSPIILLLFFCHSFYHSQAQTPAPTNSLLVHSNQPIPFDKVDVSLINQGITTLTQLSDERVKKIAAIPAGKHTLANTVMAFDELLYELNDYSSKLSLIASTYPPQNIRDAANDGQEKMSLYSSNLFLNEGLYKAFQQYASSSEAKSLQSSQQKFLKETILSFEKNGMKLPLESRKALEAINKKIIGFGTQFDKNIAQHKDSLTFSAEELTGVPANVSLGWKKPNGSFVVYINGPNYVNVLKYAEKDLTRRAMYLRYNNRAYPANLPVLDSLFYYRQKLAYKLGFRSYAEYALVDKMAATTAKVWKFENDLAASLAAGVTNDLKELRTVKHRLQPEQSDTIFAWDVSLYTKKLLDSKYQLNTDEVKEYFEMNNTLKGMFTVYEKLFNIQIKEQAHVPVWFSKVKTFEMLKEGKKIGSFYLDLYPRPDKYTHFACFPMSQYRIAGGKEVLPVSALVCNFPEGNAGEPSLLNHQDVITLFHEFGHLVHSMLGRSTIASQGPFSVKGDFVEAPSQFLENWCWEYESLKLFARHYKTGKPLPETLFNKIKQTKLVSSSLFNMRQLTLGLIDFTYEDKYDSIKGQPIMEVAEEIVKLAQMPFPKGSHFITSFGHLNGYAANYYGYMWSLVFAEDMFSVFKKKGIMDTATGVRYRKEILEKAATKEEMDMLRAFLGREPNSEAFLESLGLKGK
ncbi:MAG: M3 family metallopeptidase [Bacteroidota bacterium]